MQPEVKRGRPKDDDEDEMNKRARRRFDNDEVKGGKRS